jgi:hypothetical protein
MNKDGIPRLPTIRFIHSVGPSTLRQGISIPVEAQVSWLAGIRRGEKVPVEIRFGSGQSVNAHVRRINNAVGHLQFRYEAQRQSELRNYLRNVFGEKPEGAVLEITETDPCTFVFNPISSVAHVPPTLSLYRPHFHRLDDLSVRSASEFCELNECLASVSYDPKFRQGDYNVRIAKFLLAAGWRSEARILKEIGMRCDFEKNGVWLEVEFGNARSYYQDYIKFLLALRYQKAHFGVLLCPTDAFAQLLCELGQERATVKRRDKGRAPRYSGMMSYEKAIRELPFLQFILNGGIVVAGIDLGDSQRDSSPQGCHNPRR